jgi:nicotinamide-nucleotide amidase
MSKTAEIISVGTELLLGNIANTDAQVISQGLSELGINVYFHTVVGDNPERIRSALEIAKGRADIIITTGGLGPTYDDITKEEIAGSFGKRLVVHEPSLERIRGYFDRAGITPTKNNQKQAMLPEGCTVFDNEWGTAPGCAFEADGKHVVMLPGPPRECTPMFRECAMPYLRKLSDAVLVSRNIRIFGMGESAVEDALSNYMKSHVNPTIAPYAKEGEVMLRVTARAGTKEEAFEMTVPVVEEICARLGSVVYGVDVESLEQAVSGLLRKEGLTLAAAESCTGGMFSKRITDLPGSSDIFRGTVVAYSNEVKTDILSVPGGIIRQYGAVSEQTARYMAENVRKHLKADMGISITGVAGPAASEAKPAGLVCFGISSAKGTKTFTYRFTGNRDRVRVSSVNRAFDIIRRHILDID